MATEMEPRQLTAAEIESLAHRPGVNPIRRKNTRTR